MTATQANLRVTASAASKTLAEQNWLHLLRAVASTLVVLEHAKNRVFGADHQFAELGVAGLPLRALFDGGHEAVIVFFILSGYLVGGKILRTDPTAPHAVRDYFIDRVSRIYVVAVPALLIAAAASWLMFTVFGETRSVSPAANGDLCLPLAGDITLNWLILNKIAVKTICADSPYWSVQNEMSYYILAGLVFACVAARHDLRRLSLCGGLLAGVLLILMLEPLTMENTLLYAGLWAAGAFLALPSGRPKLLLLAIVLVGYAAVVPWIGAIDIKILARDLASAGTVCASIVLMRNCSVRFLEAGPIVSLARPMADRSYSLYLLHMPMVNFAWLAYERAGIGRAPMAAATWVSWVLLTVMVGLAFAWSYCLWSFFEGRTPVLRGVLRNLVSGAQAAAQRTP